MAFKKISLLFVGLIPLISGCTLPGTSEKVDFESLYKEHVKSEMKSVRTLAEKLGYVGKYETKGSIRAFVDIPTIFSGAADTLYDAVIEGYGLSQDYRVTFSNPSFRYETLLASGSLLAKEASIISRGGDMYLKYDGLDGVEMIDESMKEVLSKYNNVWLGLTEKNLLETLSGSSEEDRIAYQMSQAIGKMKLDEVEQYLTKYPLWKEKKSLGTVDGMAQFEVELARDNIIALVNEFSEKSTGKGLSEDARKNLETTLNEKQIQGTVSYDTKNPKLSKTHVTISSVDGPSMSLNIEENADSWNLSSESSGSMMNISLTEKSDGYAVTASLSDAEQEIGRVDAHINFRGKKFSHFDAKISAKQEGLSISMEQNMMEDGSFTGGLDAGMGNLTWNGKIGENFALESFHLKGAMVGASLSLDLTPGTGGMLTGPLLLKSGDEIVVQANVGLTMNKEKIHLMLDVANPETPEINSHAEIQLEGKKEPWSGNIDIPENSTPFSELSEALRMLAPADTWTDEVPLEESENDTESGEFMISGSVIQ